MKVYFVSFVKTPLIAQPTGIKKIRNKQYNTRNSVINNSLNNLNWNALFVFQFKHFNFYKNIKTKLIE